MKTGLIITHLNEDFVPGLLGKASVEKLAGSIDTIELSNLLSGDFDFSSDDLFFDNKGAYYSSRVDAILEQSNVRQGYVNHSGRVFFSISGELNSEASMAVREYSRLVLTGAYVNMCHLLTFKQLRNYFPNVKEFIMVGDSMANTNSVFLERDNSLISKISSDDLIDLFKGYYVGSNSFLIDEPFIVDFNKELNFLSVNINNKLFRRYKRLSMNYLMKNNLCVSKDTVKMFPVYNKPEGLLIKYFESALEALDYLS